MGKAKVNIPMCAALVLLLLTMISIHLTSGLYARYTATSTGSDSARVAKFDVKGDIEGTVELTSSMIEAGKCTLTVTNASEVAVKYAISVTFDSEVDDAKLKVQLDNAAGTWSTDEKTVDFGNKGNLAPNVAGVNHELSFDVTDWSFVTATADSDTASKTLNFTVNIHAEQID